MSRVRQIYSSPGWHVVLWLALLALAAMAMVLITGGPVYG